MNKRMEVKFLGTSASPSMPIPFCTCEVCTEAQKVRGKNLRRRSAITINDDLLIDMGPDIITSSFDNKISLANIHYCLQTHPHEDHFDPEIIISRHKDYGTEVAADLLIVGSRVTLSMMDGIIARRCTYGSIFDSNVQAAFRIKLKIIMPYRVCKIGSYQVIGYPANHHPMKGSLLYSIERDNYSVLYCTDTSIISEIVWDHLQHTRKRYDLIILDHTYGIGYESKPGDHLAGKDFISHVERFMTSKLLKTNGRIYATHLSHEGIMEHGKLDNYAKKNNYRIAYDGLRITMGG